MTPRKCDLPTYNAYAYPRHATTADRLISATLREFIGRLGPSLAREVIRVEMVPVLKLKLTFSRR